MSAYALLAQAWGAEVRGWDRVQTPYLEQLEGIDVEISDEPSEPPEGWEAFVSTAFAGRVAGKTRAELLAELVSLRDSIVVAGAHGKTTTSGMIAFCLERLGRDPAWLIGADVPQLGGNAGTGAGWLVVEGDESDRTDCRVAATRRGPDECRPRPSHDVRFASRGGRALRGMARERPGGRARRGARPVRRAARTCRSSTIAATPPLRSRRSSLQASAAPMPRPYSRSFAAQRDGSSTAARQEASTSTTTMPTIRPRSPRRWTRSETAGTAACSCSSSLISFRAPRHLARELARALAAADVVAVTDVYPAREEPVEGVTGKLVVDALADLRPGMLVGWTPSVETAHASSQVRPVPATVW